MTVPDQLEPDPPTPAQLAEWERARTLERAAAIAYQRADQHVHAWPADRRKLRRLTVLYTLAGLVGITAVIMAPSFLAVVFGMWFLCRTDPDSRRNTPTRHQRRRRASRVLRGGRSDLADRYRLRAEADSVYEDALIALYRTECELPMNVIYPEIGMLERAL